MSRILVNRGINSHLEREPERCLAYLEQSNRIFTEIKDERGSHMCQAYFIEYHTFLTKQLDQALVYAKQNYNYHKESGNKHLLGWALMKLGVCYYLKKDHDQAWKYLKQSWDLLEDIGSKLALAFSHLYISLHYNSMKKTNQAVRHLQRIEVLGEEMGIISLKAVSYNNLGFIYRDKGDFNKALEFFQKSVPIYKGLNNKHVVANLLHIIGYIYYYKDEIALTQKHFEQSKRLFEELGDEECIIWTLWSIINTIDETIPLQRVQHHLEALEKIINRKTSKTSLYVFQAAKGIILEKSPRIKDKAQAQDLFRNIWEKRTTVDSRIIRTVIFHLIDILIGEAKAYGSEEAIREAKAFLQEFYSLKGSTSLDDIIDEIDVLIIQSKFALLDGNLITAENFLNKARFLAEKKTLDFQLAKVATEQQYLENQMDLWQKLIKDNAPLQKRLEEARILEYLKKARIVAGIEITNSFTDKELPYTKFSN
jgi:tetratricopeptide (TPR) repeat protein